MFSKTDKPTTSSTDATNVQHSTGNPAPSPAPALAASGGGASPPSILSADIKITGNIESAGDIQIQGTIHGDVHSKTVTINQGAHIEGSIHADIAEISGSIKGQVRAQTVNITKSAKVVGDIIHETVAIEAGAYLEGQYRRLESEPAPASKPAAKPAAKSADASASSNAGSDTPELRVS